MTLHLILRKTYSMKTPKELFDAKYIQYRYRDANEKPPIPLEARQMIFDLMEQYAKDKSIQTLSKLGETLYEKVGVDSYESRCIIHDFKESIKRSNT